MREKFCMRCGTPLNGAARCPACGYEPQHDACEGPGGPVPEGQSAAQPAAEPTPAAPREATAGPAAPGESAPQAPQHVPPAAGPAPAAQPAAAPGPQAPQAGAPCTGFAAARPVPPPQAHTAPGGAQPPFGPAPGMAPPAWGGPQPGPAQGPQAGRQAAPPYAAPGAVPPPARNVSPAPGMPPYAVPGAYAQPYTPWEPQPEPLTLGRTVGTLLVGALPLVGWIVLLIWAFESGAEPNRRTLARGYLVVKAIGWALAVLMYVLLFVFAFSMAGAMV